MAKLTVYNVDDDSYTEVDEPDPSITYTYADYYSWKFEERLELFKGKIFRLLTPNTKHQRVVTNLACEIYEIVKRKKYHVFFAPFDVRLPFNNMSEHDEVTTVVQPDICVICDEAKLDERGCCGAPDIAVEILLPGNSRKEIRLKHELYEEAGVKEYWIVYPEEESIIVFILNDEGKLNPHKVYAGGDIIKSHAVKGLNINVTEIFTN